MEYFLLNSECYFVKGALRGAIYNLESNSVISVGPELARIIDSLEQLLPLTLVLEDCPNKGKALEFLYGLVEDGIGQFYEKPTLIEKIKPRFSKLALRRAYQFPKLNLLYIEITEECNFNCSFCRQAANNVVKRKGCVRWSDEHKSILDDNVRIKVLLECKELGCDSIVFMGGNPFTDWIKLKNMLEAAKRIGYKSISVLTNGTLIGEEVVSFIKENKINIILQHFSFNESKYNSIVKSPNAYMEVVNTLEVLKKYDIGFSCILTIVDDCEVDDTKMWLKNYKPKSIISDPLYLPEHVTQEWFIKRYCKKSSSDVLPYYFNRDVFFQRCQGHSCLDGQLTVTLSGDIIPCPYLRDEIMGNVNNESMKILFGGRFYEKYWDLTKDKVEICRDCEYRYVCFDCKLFRSDLFCKYNPTKGIWEK